MAEDQPRDDTAPEDDVGASEDDAPANNEEHPLDGAESLPVDAGGESNETPAEPAVSAAPSPPEDQVIEATSTPSEVPSAPSSVEEAEEEEDVPAPADVPAAQRARARSSDTKYLAARRPGGVSPGIAEAIARSLWEEVVYPRARVKAALRRAEHHAKRFPTASAIALAFVVGLPFIMFVSAGLGAGVLGWAVFVTTAIFFIVGCPLLLIYAWPLTAVAVAVGCVWVHLSMGEGALWLGVATISAMLILYFATTEVVPFLAAGIVTSFVRDSGTAVSVATFCVSALFFLYYRYTMTGPLLYAGWVAISSAIAAQIACWSIGDAMPLTWLRGPVMGPEGTTLWALTIASIAGLLVIPKKRRYRKVIRIKSIAEQLPP